MHRLFANRLALLTGAIVIATSALFALERVTEKEQPSPTVETTSPPP
jgi:hypothetical protein